MFRHSIVTTFRGVVIKVEVANFGAAIDTLIDQDGNDQTENLKKPQTFTVEDELQRISQIRHLCYAIFRLALKCRLSSPLLAITVYGLLSVHTAYAATGHSIPLFEKKMVVRNGSQLCKYLLYSHITINNKSL